MIKVLIVDDEPFIRQGLKILIDWKSNGYEVTCEASNGVEALKKLEETKVDLIITDIKMPEMNGLELIEKVNEKYGHKIKFIVLSGFYEFEYAKKAIKYGVKDYVLKPIQKEELNNVLKDLKSEFDEDLKKIEFNQIAEKISYDININNLINGKKDNVSLENIKSKLNIVDYMRFLLIEINTSNSSKINDIKKELFNKVKSFLNDNEYNIISDIEDKKNSKCIGVIFDPKFLNINNCTEREYINRLFKYLKDDINYDLYMYVGTKACSIEDLKESYEYATILKVSTSDKDILYYEDIYNKEDSTRIMQKEYMDNLISAIEENDNNKIKKSIDEFYDSLKEKYIDFEMIKINIDYLLFNLINIEKETNDQDNNEEILDFIRFLSIENIISRNSKDKLLEFSFNFANYLSDIRKNSSKGILGYIDKEISEHYMDKLSLKSLSEKYYLNSAYLGQIFKKKYHVSFKDYLNEYRIEKAAELLKRSDEKVYKIAEKVGYSNTDYFINKFMQIKGKTPYQYRKQFFEEEII